MIKLNRSSLFKGIGAVVTFWTALLFMALYPEAFFFSVLGFAGLAISVGFFFAAAGVDT